MGGRREKLKMLLGTPFAPVNHLEKIISSVGGLVGMMLVLGISNVFLDGVGATWVVGSIGASAVLLFAVPHGQLSQPWPLLGGQVVSAAIGVTCAILISDPSFAASMAVAGSIAAMYYLRCIHPPGGATALTAVLGGATVHAMGYFFVLVPVLLNVMVLLVAAVVVNALFPWRRYPLALANRLRQPPPSTEESPGFHVDRADLEWAMRQMNSYIDVAQEDLERIFSLAYRHAREHHMMPEEISLGGCYSNGRFGEDWQVRKIVDASCTGGARDYVIYRVMAGMERGSSKMCQLEEFARWARYRVYRNENSWQRMENGVRTGLAEQGA
jgi:CBS-domain-containing membrane protein